LLPLEDVYNFAAQYGANFQNEILTPLIQAAVSVIGFVIVVALGALYSLNGMAGSLNNLVHVATLVANGDFSQRVEESGPQEMIGFIRCFNKMIDSILEGQNSLQRKQAELTRTLQIREKEFRLMVSLSELITKTGSLYQKLDLALNAIASTLPLNDAMLFLYEENEFIQVAHTNPDPCLESSILYATLESAKEGKIYVVDHSTVSQCILAIPLTYREKILGVLLCLYPEPLNLTDPSISFLDAISKQVAILIENIRLQDQERSLLITEERNRLARELHDSVTQSLFSLIMIAEGLQIKSQELELPQSCSTGLEMLLKQAQQIQADLRSMIYELQPLSPKDLNLKDRIHYHMSKIENTMGIQTRIHLKGNLEEVPLMLQRNVDRILQEALSNVARHSHATLVEVEIELEENRLFISIADNGIGFDTASILQSSSSYGLMNMRERVELMGGTFSVKSSKSEGTIISAIIPLCTS
ncbi:MAG: histidine kinase, partial [Candidatus Methanomethylicaceae archaeon]